VDCEISPVVALGYIGFVVIVLDIVLMAEIIGWIDIG
jgi:hypothetical protein